MLPFPGFESSDGRLGCTDAFSYFSLRYPCGSTSAEKLIKKPELFIQSIILCFHICALKSAGFKFFVGEHFCIPSFFFVLFQVLLVASCLTSSQIDVA